MIAIPCSTLTDQPVQSCSTKHMTKNGLLTKHRSQNSPNLLHEPHIRSSERVSTTSIVRDGKPSASTMAHKPTYLGGHVIARPLCLELVDTPMGWRGETPETLGIQTLLFPIWVFGGNDVPTLEQLKAFIQARFNKALHPLGRFCRYSAEFIADLSSSIHRSFDLPLGFSPRSQQAIGGFGREEPKAYD